MKSIQGSSRRIETFSRTVHFFIALILGIFLSALGSKILDDLDSWYVAPLYEDYQDTESITDLENQKESNVKTKLQLRERLTQLDAGYAISDRNYISEKESFDNWIKSRETIGDPNQDPAIKAKLKKLDELNEIKSSWQLKIDTIRDSLVSLSASEKEFNNKLAEQVNFADQKFETDLRSYRLKIFVVRLIFALPILALGLFLFMKYRDTRYKAFVWGIVFFSLYLFFIGLVPYLPSYGGYVRYIVGIVVTVVVGYYLIKQITVYFDKKRAELQRSMEERVDTIQYGTAIKSYQLHSCPSCEKDYHLIKDTDNKPNFCIHCGLLLFKNCEHCGQRNYAHFDFCSSCGHELKSKKELGDKSTEN